MDARTAHLLLYLIAAVASLAWLAGLWFLRAVARQPRVEEPFDRGESAERLPIQGTAEVDGDPETLAARAASILAKGGVAQFGPVRIVGRTTEAVVFEGDVAGAGLGQYIRHGVIHFSPLDRGRTRIEYALELPRGKALLAVGAAFQLLGLAAIALGFWLLSVYVVDSPSPAVRIQTVQMVQVCHFLWPPFLCGVLYRRRHGTVQKTFDTLIRNLPFYEA